MNVSRVAVDIGGTFTDVVVTDGLGGVIGSSKILTTPGDPAQGFMAGIDAALVAYSILPGDVDRVVHASTLVTNAIIERRGAPIGLLTTEGFRDTLQFGTETRYDLYDLHLVLPEPLVPRHLRAEVTERLGANGQVLEPLNLPDALRTVTHLVEQHGIEALAICLLHAHINPTHEQQLAAAIRELHPQLHLSLSSEVAPFIREYARSSTTVANAFVQPPTIRYLNQIRSRLEAATMDRAATYLMLSHGGLVDLDSGALVPIRLCESGPAAGVIAAAHMAERIGAIRAIAFDMGGTTAKMCSVIDGLPLIGRELEVAHESRFMAGSGLPLTIQSVQLLEIGAGGGSIAGLDVTGLLEVGPQSAGAEPGPACYGRGGVNPTVTDANLLLGNLPDSLRLGGHLALDKEAAEEAFAPLAKYFGQTPVQVARAVFDLVNEKMALAMRRHMVEHGHEPAGFTLITTGGAGPLHACSIAANLDIRRVIVPAGAGVGSAIGLLMARYVVERSRSQLVTLALADPAQLRSVFRELEAEATRSVDPAFGDHYSARYFADVRYSGQGYELPVEISADLIDSPGLLAETAKAFGDAYRQRFGRQLSEWPIEVLAFTVRLESPQVPTNADYATYESSEPMSSSIWDAGHWQIAHVRPWSGLPLEIPHSGPLVITDTNTTVLVPNGWTVWRRPTYLDLRPDVGEE